MRKLSIDSDDDAIFPDETGKMNSVEAANTPKKMRYFRKIYASLLLIFLVFAVGSMTLFITPGVREFVQNYQFIVYLCTPLPIVSKILFSAVQRLQNLQSSQNSRLVLQLIAFTLHLLAIFLSLTSLSLFFDTEFFYFTCFTVFLNQIILIMYTFQSYKILSFPAEITLFLLLACVGNVFLVQLILSIFDFPYLEIVVLSLMLNVYVEHNICFFMSSLTSKEWPVAVSNVFVRVPM